MIGKILFINGIADDKLVKYYAHNAIDTFGSSNIYKNLSIDNKEEFLMDSNDETNISL